MPVPFLGRLNITEYVALVGSFLLVGLEAFIRIFTLALPPSLLELFYGISRRLFNRLTTPAQKRAEQRKRSISTSIRNASDFVDLCATFGYTAEEHVVQTKDGYLLGLHRLAWRKGEEDIKVNRGLNSVRKRVVYLHHGLLMNSEVWVCLTDEQRALPFVLVEKGFDVWLGNNRGNKYSKKSIHSSPTSLKFWNFSIDEFAFHDIPDSIGYILETTSQKSLSYIGFSQGTAQAFASLSIHPKLNDQVNVFIALAPAMSPAGLSNGVVDALVKASPQVLFLLFGRRSILSSAAMWEALLYPPLFTKLIDLGLAFLFNWRTQNISTSQKLAAYPHLYSYTSTKSVVHWFQIIRNKSFQMYDDDVHPPLGLLTTGRTSRRYTKVAKYPTRNIKTPIVLVYGGSDSLVDIKAMLRELPAQTLATEVPHYEHLDFLWARDVREQVFVHVFDALESFTGTEHTREEYERYRVVRENSTLAMAGKGGLLGGEKGRRKQLQMEMGLGSGVGLGSEVGDSDVSTAVNHEDEEEEGMEVEVQREEGREKRAEGGGSKTAAMQTVHEAALHSALEERGPSLIVAAEPHRHHPHPRHPHPHAHPPRETHIPSPTGGPPGIAQPRRSSKGSLEEEQQPRQQQQQQSTAESTTKPPTAAVETKTQSSTTASQPPQPAPPQPPKRSGSSQMSIEKGGRGISLGASKAVGGVTTATTSTAGSAEVGPTSGVRAGAKGDGKSA